MHYTPFVRDSHNYVCISYRGYTLQSYYIFILLSFYYGGNLNWLSNHFFAVCFICIPQILKFNSFCTTVYLTLYSLAHCLWFWFNKCITISWEKCCRLHVMIAVLKCRTIIACHKHLSNHNIVFSIIMSDDTDSAFAIYKCTHRCVLYWMHIIKHVFLEGLKQPQKLILDSMLVLGSQ